MPSSVAEIFVAVAFAGAGAAELAGIGERVLARARASPDGWTRKSSARGSALPPAGLRSALRCMSVRKREAPNGSKPARAEMPTPMPSASNSCAREKLASVELRLGERQRAHLRIAEHVVDHVADDGGLPRLFLADRGVARDHVAHLVRQHRGELGLVVGERDQSARDVELAVRQREGVDRRRVEDGHLVFQVRPFGCRHQPVDGLFDRRLQPRVLVDAAIGGEDAQRARAASAGCRSACAAACGTGSETWRLSGVLVQPASSTASASATPRARFAVVSVAAMTALPESCQSTNSICSGASAAMIGPPRCSIHPRTRMRRPSSCFGSTPAAAKVALQASAEW